MTNPVLVEVTRGSIVESRHRGAISIVDSEGRSLLSVGDIERGVFPRSAVKLIQALPLVESGAADALGFGPRELALACASHNGEEIHVGLAGEMLARVGRSAADLECSTHAPTDSASARTLIRLGERPNTLHNNCSGKHAGFVCLSCHLGHDPKGYVTPDHPVQREVTAALEALTGMTLGPDIRATDGCSIPTFAIPLSRLADAFSRAATGRRLPAGRAAAAQRLMKACMAEPYLVAGTKRFCTDAMSALPGRLFVKTGAEGVYSGAIPDLGIGIALKCDDGATRGAETMMAAVIAAFFPEIADGPFAPWLAPPVDTRSGVKVGEIRPVTDFIESIHKVAASFR